MGNALHSQKIHQIKLIIVANYEWEIIKLEIGKDETHYKLLFYQGKGGREIFFFLLQTVVEIWEKEVGTVKILR
jgi:hypothetical protein